MKKQLLTITELQALGFVEIKGDELDNGGYYRWWAFHKNDCELHITYEFNAKNEFTTGAVEFNGETLKGREITTKDLTFLIDLM